MTIGNFDKNYCLKSINSWKFQKWKLHELNFCYIKALTVNLTYNIFDIVTISLRDRREIDII